MACHVGSCLGPVQCFTEVLVAYLGLERLCLRPCHSYGRYFDAACGHGHIFDTTRTAANQSRGAGLARRRLGGAAIAIWLHLQY